MELKIKFGFLVSKENLGLGGWELDDLSDSGMTFARLEQEIFPQGQKRPIQAISSALRETTGSLWVRNRSLVTRGEASGSWNTGNGRKDSGITRNCRLKLKLNF